MKCPQCDFENSPQSSYCAKCGFQLVSLPDSSDSTQLYSFSSINLESGAIFAGRYQVLEELGSGGMGKVYKVIDKEVNEKIAIKILKPEISYDQEIIERFRNELKLARKISHPNVCRMYDLLKEKGLYFITMEYISGEDLKRTISRLGQLSVGKALVIAEQICRGLAAAHRLNVVHRDLKPHNIIIDRLGDARLMDFGIAQTQTTKGLTKSGVMIGTPEYMSPEQAVGEDTDQRSDIYSLGIILFELLTGTVPFKGDTAVGIALKQKTEPPPNPKSLNPQIPDEVNLLILRCLEKDKNKRYQSVVSLLEDISQIQRGFPTTDRLISQKPPTTAGKKTGKRPFPFVNPIILVLVLMAAGIGYLLFNTILKVEKKAKVEIAKTQTLELGRSFNLPFDQIEMTDVAYGTDESRDVSSSKSMRSSVVSNERGLINISSEPSGAVVYLNGNKLSQKTPAKIRVIAGTYRVKVEHSNYLDEIGEFRVEPGKAVQGKFTLKPAYLIDICSDPLEASVFIDGEFRGKTPQLKIKLAKPTCFIKLERLGYEPHTEELHLNLGLNTPKNIALKKILVKMSIQTKPSKAMITIDDKPLGLSPLDQQIIGAGNHILLIEKEGYNTEKYEIEFYEDFRKSFSLTPIQYETIEVFAYPQAAVYLDGSPVMDDKGFPLVVFTGRKKIKVPVGPHKIEFVSTKTNEKLSETIIVEIDKSFQVYGNFSHGKIYITLRE